MPAATTVTASSAPMTPPTTALGPAASPALAISFFGTVKEPRLGDGVVPPVGVTVAVTDGVAFTFAANALTVDDGVSSAVAVADGVSGALSVDVGVCDADSVDDGVSEPVGDEVKLAVSEAVPETVGVALADAPIVRLDVGVCEQDVVVDGVTERDGVCVAVAVGDVERDNESVEVGVSVADGVGDDDGLVKVPAGQSANAGHTSGAAARSSQK